MKTSVGKILYLNRLSFAKEMGTSIYPIEDPWNPNGSSTYSYGYLDYIHLYCIEFGHEYNDYCAAREIKFKIPFENGKFNFMELRQYLEKRDMKMCPPVEYLELFLWKT